LKVLIKKFAIVALAMGLQATPLLAADWRLVDENNTILIDTTKGQVIVELYPEIASLHVERILTLTRSGFYNNVKFHRVVEGFMAQTGDPKGDGSGESTLPDLTPEFTMRRNQNFDFAIVNQTSGLDEGFHKAMPVRSQVSELMSLTKDGRVEAWGAYCSGTMGMARTQDPNSANSQFYLMRGPTPTLEKDYTAFGKVISGIDVVRRLKTGEPVINPDIMTRVRVLADIPTNERPRIEIMDTHSAAFDSMISQMKKNSKAGFSLCDVTIPVKITPAS
jgi:peptidylprolyl isomerase